MTESITQGIPFLKLGKKNIRLYKCNDISFANLKKDGFDCQKSGKKPDQLVCYNKKVLIGIEDKQSSSDLPTALKQIRDNYLDALPDTRFFIVRAGDVVKVYYRITSAMITEISTSLKGKDVVCFGPKVVTGENAQAKKHLALLSEQVLQNKEPTNGNIEILPPKVYYNPLLIKKETIFNLWQKIFVATGENAHICLSTFVELLLYKGISDAGMLPSDYAINQLSNPKNSNSLYTYINVVRSYISTKVFPTISNQPGIINGFAFVEQETIFKTVLRDLCDLGNLAQRQLDPDFKRRVIEAFLGSAHREGAIKSGKHLTPRIVIQAIWEMAEPEKNKRIVDPACGVGGFVLEGINYPYEFDPIKYSCIGIDRDEQMIITAKANMILHILDRLSEDVSNRKSLADKVNTSFYHAKNNGTGTLGELEHDPKSKDIYRSRHAADYVLTNIPFYVNGVTQIDDSLSDMGFSSFYEGCGLGIESRFIRYILSQIQQGTPGIAFVIVTDGILYRHKDKIRSVINKNADVVGMISLPVGCFQNNNWKTSILIMKKKGKNPEHSPVFLYNVENIGVSLDAYRTPIEENDIPGLKKAWNKRTAGFIEDDKCRLVNREDFLEAKRWSDLFDWCRSISTDDNISFIEFVEAASSSTNDIVQLLKAADKDLGEIFAVESFIEIAIGDDNYFNSGTSDFKTTVKHARLHPGEYPLFSSQVSGPVELMFDKDNPPLLIENETKNKSEKMISWNIKGDPCKDIRLHDKPFYCTENRGLIAIKDDNIHLPYLLYYLREHLINAGGFKRSDEAHAGKVKSIRVKIPTKTDGSIDTDRQEDIARNYEKILKLRQTFIQKLDELKSLLSNIDVFK
ncbi:MAG: N-6 DNA methylase [Syntrophales bacterium]